jgi:hypothetical protein
METDCPQEARDGNLGLHFFAELDVPFHPAVIVNFVTAACAGVISRLELVAGARVWNEIAPADAIVEVAFLKIPRLLPQLVERGRRCALRRIVQSRRRTRGGKNCGGQRDHSQPNHVAC